MRCVAIILIATEASVCATECLLLVRPRLPGSRLKLAIEGHYGCRCDATNRLFKTTIALLLLGPRRDCANRSAIVLFASHTLVPATPSLLVLVPPFPILGVLRALEGRQGGVL